MFCMSPPPLGEKRWRERIAGQGGHLRGQLLSPGRAFLTEAVSLIQNVQSHPQRPPVGQLLQGCSRNLLLCGCGAGDSARHTQVPRGCLGHASTTLWALALVLNETRAGLTFFTHNSLKRDKATRQLFTQGCNLLKREKKK